MTKTYLVTITEKNPAAGERSTPMEIEAATKAEAIKKARAHIRKYVWSRYDSPRTYTAAEA